MKSMLLLWQGGQVSGSKSWRVHDCYLSFPLCSHVWRLGSWYMLISCHSIFHCEREETFWSGNLNFSLLVHIFMISEFANGCSFFWFWNKVGISFPGCIFKQLQITSLIYIKVYKWKKKNGISKVDMLY